MAPRRSTTGSIVATAGLASVLLAVVAAGGGCEIAVGNEVPLFECLQGPAVCPDNKVCDPSSHLCVAPCNVTGCASNMQCDLGSSLCVPVVGDDGPSGGDDDGAAPGQDADASTQPEEAAPPVETGPGPETGACRGLTCPCSGAAACDSGICADSLTVPSGLYAAAGNQSFCTKPCCTSQDCDANTVCFATGAGGNFCVNPTWVQRNAPGAALGGASCGTGRDCRSGQCGTSGTCADTCCSTFASNECAPGNTCRFGTFPGAATFDKNDVFYCGHGGSRGNGSSCTVNSDCQSELCDGSNGCTNACRNTGECIGAGEACAYVTPPAAPSSTAVAACFSGPGAIPGSTPEGSNCSSDTDCQSLFCDPTSHQCTDVCFADSDCKAGWRCRPEKVTLQAGGSFSVLACGT
jgi:hypothetical protein